VVLSPCRFLLLMLLLQTYQGALDMLENVYIKTGGTDKCFGSDSGGHGSDDTIRLTQGVNQICICLSRSTAGFHAFAATIVHPRLSTQPLSWHQKRGKQTRL
jgi:hypothetical protein